MGAKRGAECEKKSSGSWWGCWCCPWSQPRAAHGWLPTWARARRRRDRRRPRRPWLPASRTTTAPTSRRRREAGPRWVPGSRTAATGAGGTGAAATSRRRPARRAPRRPRRRRRRRASTSRPRPRPRRAPGRRGNTASDVGVTPTSITFGNVSGMTGPLTGSLPAGQPGRAGALRRRQRGRRHLRAQARARRRGRPAERHRPTPSDVADLIPKVLAFVGSTSDADNGGVPAMTSANIPDVGFAINCNRSEEPVYWSPAGRQLQPDAARAGRIYISDGDLPAGQAVRATSRPRWRSSPTPSPSAPRPPSSSRRCTSPRAGRSATPTSPSRPPRRRSRATSRPCSRHGCNGVIDTMDVTGNAKLLQAMQQQSYTPRLRRGHLRRLHAGHARRWPGSRRRRG